MAACCLVNSTQRPPMRAFQQRVHPGRASSKDAPVWNLWILTIGLHWLASRADCLQAFFTLFHKGARANEPIIEAQAIYANNDAAVSRGGGAALAVHNT